MFVSIFYIDRLTERGRFDVSKINVGLVSRRIALNTMTKSACPKTTVLRGDRFRSSERKRRADTLVRNSLYLLEIAMSPRDRYRGLFCTRFSIALAFCFILFVFWKSFLFILSKLRINGLFIHSSGNQVFTNDIRYKFCFTVYR